MIFYKRQTDKEVEYYRQEEADELGLEYIPWRDAVTEGQWVLTDDGYVLKTTKVKTIVETRYKKTRVRRRIHTGLCWRYPHSKLPMEIERHMEVGHYCMIPKEWWERYKVAYPALDRLLIKAILLGELPFGTERVYTDAQREVFKRIAEKIMDNGNGHNVRIYFNRNEVRMGLQEEIKKMAAEQECTLEEVFKLYKEAKVIARRDENIKGLIMVGDRYASIIGMTSKLVTTPEQKQLPLPEDDAMFQKVLSDNG